MSEIKKKKKNRQRSKTIGINPKKWHHRLSKIPNPRVNRIPVVYRSWLCIGVWIALSGWTEENRSLRKKKKKRHEFIHFTRGYSQNHKQFSFDITKKKKPPPVFIRFPAVTAFSLKVVDPKSNDTLLYSVYYCRLYFFIVDKNRRFFFFFHLVRHKRHYE